MPRNGRVAASHTPQLDGVPHLRDARRYAEGISEYPCPDVRLQFPTERINALRDETFASSNYAMNPKFTDHVSTRCAPSS